ncbi:hypothetical protein CEXT_189011 [Caerostris extrusa]|uniref:Uncharacterized protein n=1 Tax=Caerostris extrusa TaxID=172846 RepID=A0AAV4PV45_CAEEX|nr:hypothetical protein CEXT_189011 [Caerostris extrusa]
MIVTFVKVKKSVHSLNMHSQSDSKSHLEICRFVAGPPFPPVRFGKGTIIRACSSRDTSEAVPASWFPWQPAANNKGRAREGSQTSSDSVIRLNVYLTKRTRV